MVIVKILEYVVTPSVIVIVIGFVAKSVFTQFMSKDIERYKLRLKAEYDNSKIRIENELRIRLFEFQTRFSLYHQQRAKSIQELYSLLSDTYDSLVNLTRTLQIKGQESLEERKKNTATIHNAMKQYYQRNRIFYSRDICEKVESIAELMKRAYIDFDIAQDGSDYKPDRTGLWEKSWNTISCDLPPLLQKLEEEFRKILEGVCAKNEK